ncbi:MAG: diguanylate cyclase, partial [Alkalimonas sp.]|nr:diguanylate cyclase [Alkalimonas sp.]
MLESYAKLTPGAFYLFQSDDFGRYSLPAVSEQIKAILGFDAHTLCQNPQLLFERLHPDDRSRVHTFIQQSRHDLSSFHCEYRIQHQAGHWIWLAAHSEPELLDNKITLWRGFLYDISSQKIAEQQLQQSNQSARALLDHLMDAVISIDAQGRILSFNRSAELLFGYQRHEAVGQNIRLLMPEAQAAQHDNHLARYQQGGKPSIVGSKRRLEAKHKDGRQFPIELRVAEMPHPDGKRFVGVLRDLSRQHRQDKVMQQLKQRDPLTQLPNRHAFLHTLSDVVKRRNSTPLQFALFLLNLDNFKQLNNATSHGFGDVALLEIARRLQQHFGSMYKLARLGGDEFAIIWPLLPAEHSPTLPELHTAVEQLQALIARPIAGAGYQCQLTACIGICMLAESMRPDQWLQSAEIALKAAKQQSCNSYQIYTEELATRDQLQGQ